MPVDYSQTVGIRLEDDFSDVRAQLQQLRADLEKVKQTIATITVASSHMITVMKQMKGITVDTKMTEQLVAYLEQATKYAKELAKQKIKVPVSYNATGTTIDPYSVNQQNIIKFQQNTNKAKDYIKKVGEQADKTRLKLNQMFSIGKIYFFINYFKQMFRMLGNWINTAIDFYEIDNLFSNAMGNMYDTAMAYQSKLTDMYGMSTNTMMQAQATYKNMIGNLGGLSEEMSYKLSEIVTNMTLDFSSLYNVDIDKAVAKFQSALSKQVRPIRSTSGMDITQNVLQMTASNLGIDKTISQMNEIEKRMLIILTLADQMKNAGAFEDFARTIQSPANELRILKEQVIELGKWIGNTLLGAFANLIPYVTAVVMLLKEAFMWLSGLIGFEYGGSTGTIMDDITGAEDSADNIASSFGSASDSAKEIKKSLAGFDKLNIISKPKESSSGGGGGGSLPTIDPLLLKALEDLEYGLDNIKLRATEIKENIQAWFSNVKTDVLDKFQGFFDFIVKNKDPLLAIFSAIGGFAVGKGLVELFTKFNLNDTLLDIAELLEKAGLGKFADTLLELPKNFKNTFNKIKPLTKSFANFFKNPMGTIKNLILGIPSAIKAAFTFLTTPANLAVGAIGLVVGAVTYCLTTNEDFRNRFIEALKTILSSAGSIIGSIISIFTGLWNNVLMPLVAWFVETFGPHIGTVLSIVGEAVLFLLETFAGLLEFIAVIFSADWSNAWDSICQVTSELFFGMWDAIVLAGSDAWQGIQDVFSSVAQFFETTFSNAWNAVKKVFSTGGQIFDGIKDGIVSAFAKIVNGIISGINKVIARPFNSLNNVLYTIRNFSIAGLKPFANLSYVSVPSIPMLQYATGGFPNVGEMFIANERGPELVGTLGGKPAVANNQQIEAGIADASYRGMKQALTETKANQSGDVYIQNEVKIGDETVAKTMKKVNKDEVLKTGEPVFEETW